MGWRGIEWSWASRSWRCLHKPTETEFTAVISLKNANCDVVMMGTILRILF